MKTKQTKTLKIQDLHSSVLTRLNRCFYRVFQTYTHSTILVPLSIHLYTSRIPTHIIIGDRFYQTYRADLHHPEKRCIRFASHTALILHTQMPPHPSGRNFLDSNKDDTSCFDSPSVHYQHVAWFRVCRIRTPVAFSPLLS